MASNAIPESYDPLIELMEDAADGAHQHEVAIGLLQNKEAAIRADLETLVGTPAGPGNVPPAVPGLKALWNIAKAQKTSMTAALRTACSNGRALAMTCIGTLKPAFGNQWNSAWNAVGFTESSLAVPTNPMVKLQQLRAYYFAHPAKEVANVNTIACTAVACEAAVQAIGAAQSDSNQSNTDAGLAQAALEAGIAKARARLTGLREELAQLIGDDDERWYAFGFDKPSDPITPDVPENLTATSGAPGSRTLFLNCDDARRAERGYRFRVTNPEGSAEYANVLTTDSEAVVSFTISGDVKVTVTSRNAAGESLPSAPLIATVI